MSTTEMKKSKNLHTVDSDKSIFLQNKKQKADLIKPTLFCSSKEKNQSNNAQDVRTKKRRQHCNDEVIHSNHIKKKQSITVDKMFRINQTENKRIIDIESYLEAIGEKPRILDFTRGMDCARYEITQKILKCLHLS